MEKTEKVRGPRGCGAPMAPWRCGELMPAGAIALCGRCQAPPPRTCEMEFVLFEDEAPAAPALALVTEAA